MHAGRADYFGTLPNLAARVSAVAAAGQILVEAGSSMQRHGLPMSREDSAAFIPLQRSLSSVAGDGEHVRLDLLGCYMLKVSGPLAACLFCHAVHIDLHFPASQSAIAPAAQQETITWPRHACHCDLCRQ